MHDSISKRLWEHLEQSHYKLETKSNESTAIYMSCLAVLTTLTEYTSSVVLARLKPINVNDRLHTYNPSSRATQPLLIHTSSSIISLNSFLLCSFHSSLPSSLSSLLDLPAIPTNQQPRPLCRPHNFATTIFTRVFQNHYVPVPVFLSFIPVVYAFTGLHVHAVFMHVRRSGRGRASC